jgi:acetylglutamate kinase
MDVMEMVVCGSISKRVVARLALAGQPALGLSGADLGLLRCRRYVAPSGADLGRVGAITRVDVAALLAIIAQGWLPVFAPVALGDDDGLAYNVNADHVAQAIAIALSAGERRTDPAELTFVSNVPGVMLAGQVQAQLTAADIEVAIDSGEIRDGMVPKVRSALAALAAGVTTARICDLPGFENGGTRIVAGE